MKNIAVIGGGYVGLVTAACFAELGHKVNVIEIDTAKVKSLVRGEIPINEPGLAELWRRNQADGRLQVTDSYIKGLEDTEFAFIAVGTPSGSNGKPNLKWVRLAARSIAESASGPLMVVIKSTVPVGTAEVVENIIIDSGRNGHRFSIVSNPEFLREGAAVYDFMNPTRVVVGAANAEAADAVAGLYRKFESPLIKCDNKTAEMAKYASNVFLATRISFMNEMALLCEEYAVDIVKVAEIMGLDPRFGKDYLNAGLGWGGSCLPKDVKGLIHMAKNRNVPLRIVRAVQHINQQQPHIVVHHLRNMLGSLQGKTIGILGLAFKPNSDDIREARSLCVISVLEDEGCRIKAYDPMAMEVTAKLLPSVTYGKDAYDVAKDADALVLVTEWEEFKGLDMQLLASLMKKPVMVDGRNLYDPDKMRQAGFTYEGIGRGKARASITGSGARA
jgi:UDPglucose 6-dehydrogenase